MSPIPPLCACPDPSLNDAFVVVDRATPFVVPDSSDTAIEWDNEVTDPYGFHVTTPGLSDLFTVPSGLAGTYAINASLTFANDLLLDIDYFFSIYLNGSPLYIRSSIGDATLVNHSVEMPSIVYPLADGDVINFFLEHQGNGAPLSTGIDMQASASLFRVSA